MQIALSVSPSFTPVLSHSLMCTLSFYLSLSLSAVLCVLWCFIWYPTIKPLFELPSIVYGFFLWGETESCLKGLQSRRLPSYWCRGVLPSSLLDQSLTSLLFYGRGHFTERSLTTSPQRFAKRYSSDSRGGWMRRWRAAGGFWRQEEMNLDSVTVTHTHTHTHTQTHTSASTYLSSLQLWEPLVFPRCGWVKQKASRRPQDVVEAISVTLWMQNLFVMFPRFTSTSRLCSLSTFCCRATRLNLPLWQKESIYCLYRGSVNTVWS